MARINIDDSLLMDERFDYVCKKIGKKLAIGDWYCVAKTAQKYWLEGEKPIPKKIWEIGDYSEYFIESGLVTEVDNGYYLAGSDKFFSWLVAKTENGKKGGRPRNINKIKKATESYGKLNESYGNPPTLPPTPTLPPITINTKEYNNIYTFLLDHWNSKKIITHLKNDATLLKIEKAFKKFKKSKEDAIKSIDNFSFILNSPDYIWSHKWTLWEFLSLPKASKFYPDEFNLELFPKNRVSSAQQKQDSMLLKENPYARN